MRRREFIAGFGAAAAWPLAARAQQGNRVRRLGILIAGRPELGVITEVGIPALRNALYKLGWVEGRNLTTDVLFGEDDPIGMVANRNIASCCPWIHCPIALRGHSCSRRRQRT
jgi:hypothetical protein